MDWNIDSRPITETRGKPKYPFRQLEVGQSFWAPIRQLNVTAWHHATGYRFTARKETVDGITGTRVWRIE